MKFALSYACGENLGEALLHLWSDCRIQIPVSALQLRKICLPGPRSRRACRHTSLPALLAFALGRLHILPSPPSPPCSDFLNAWRHLSAMSPDEAALRDEYAKFLTADAPVVRQALEALNVDLAAVLSVPPSDEARREFKSRIHAIEGEATSGG